MKRTLMIDFDTPVYSSAAQQQKNRCLAIHVKSGKEKLFESKTEFNNWLAKNPKFTKEDFIFDVVSEVTGKPEFAFRAIKQKFDNILRNSGCDDYYVFIQGSGNFRNNYNSPYVDYKGQRTAKPIMHPDCFDYVVRKFGDRCIVSDGVETDDLIVIKSWESYNQALSVRDKNAAPYLIAYCDKDIPANGRGWMLNYNKMEGIYWNDSLSQARQFFVQVLIGDGADNIPGILTLSDDIKTKYGIKVKGCGPASAAKILNECKTEKEMAARVVEAYQSTWPEDWKERLRDNCFFLYLQRYEGDMFDVDKFFGKYGVAL